jgi:hypothetical protein
LFVVFLRSGRISSSREVGDLLIHFSERFELARRCFPQLGIERLSSGFVLSVAPSRPRKTGAVDRVRWC